MSLLLFVVVVGGRWLWWSLATVVVVVVVVVDSRGLPWLLIVGGLGLGLHRSGTPMFRLVGVVVANRGRWGCRVVASRWLSLSLILLSFSLSLLVTLLM